MRNDTFKMIMIAVVLTIVLFVMTMCNAMIGPPNTKRVCDEMGGTMAQEEGRGSVCILRVTE